ncbi:uncharacterized protein LOC107637299 [Arachis ipaensis]|uniref:uncharacterized protein LOC107637299 n=1 Tax=Arachis ipaensis TaxID=130454 RepID=UPI0007AFA3D1|nr:uncharacterized protein LOC107637299 [Arachis ipaensis]
MEIDGGLRLLRLDMDVVKMYEAAVENGHKIELYTEYPISQADAVDTNEEAGVEAPDQGLIPAVKDIMAGAHHRFCAMHIYQNFKKQWPDLEMKAAMWACSKATTPQEFELAMGRVKRINQYAWEYLNKISLQQWSRSHFSEYPKVDFYTNNNCETFNGKIKKMRGKPIITMLEEVKGYVMRILARNKKALVGYHGRITPVQQSRLEMEKKESNYWRPFPSGDEDGNVYEVQRLPVKVSVDLGRRTCSCRLWQLTGLPCKHVCIAIAYQNRRAEDFAHNWLTMGAYNLAYHWIVQPVPSQEYWEKGNHYPLLPPVYRKPTGRPIKKRDARRDGPRENPDPHRTKRRYGPIKCTYCLKV